MYNLLWAVVVASDNDAVTTTPIEELAQRLKQRNINDLQVYTPQTHYAMQVAYPYIQHALDQRHALKPITDADPVVLDESEMNAHNVNSSA
jgi:hypothetical protein